MDSDIEDIQTGMPYFHYSNGEGMFFTPEVGARCAVLFPSDGSEPFIMAFLGIAEETSGKSTDESQTPGGASTEGKTPQEMEDEETEATDDDDMASSSDPISYQNGRPLTRGGDSFWRTRDGNGIALRRGGLVSIGANGICQRLYIPINNLIHDFAQNYNLSTPGVSRSYELLEATADTTRSESVFTIREYAEDSNSSLSIRMGELDDNFYELSIKRAGIDYKKGTVIEESDLTLKLSKSGNRELICKEETINAQSRSVYVENTETEEFGELEQTVKGARSVSFKSEEKDGTTSKETLQTSKVIESPLVQLGQGPRSKLVRADLLIIMFNSHIHLIPGVGVSGPPQVPMTTTMIACTTVEGS
jgi:hypothetical protein